YVQNIVDRTNIGNAKVAGMDKSLGLVGNQFNVSLAVFYVTYIVFEIPSNFMLKKIGGKIWLPLLVTGWGIVTTFSGFMTNYASLIIVRLLLGLFEGGLLPVKIYVLYLSTMYTKKELQLRIGVFFAFASLSGAFGGLLAYFIEKMDGVAGKKGWQWVFFLEGIGTILIAIFGVYTLPSGIGATNFLTPREKEFAMERMKLGNTLRKDSSNTPYPMLNQPSENSLLRGVNETKSSIPSDLNQKTVELREIEDITDSAEKGVAKDLLGGEKFEMYEAIRGLREPQVWMTGIGYMSICVGMYSYSLFLPTIVSGMGYRGSSAQLFSSFPYLPASALVVFVAFFGDKLQLRGPVILTLLPITMIGYILAIVAESSKLRYAAVFLMAAGIYPSVPSLLCILPNNTAGLTKRSVCTALQLMICNCAGFIATFIYTADQAPNYVKGHSIALSFSCLAWIMIGLNSIYCYRENKARGSGLRDKNLEMYQSLIQSGKSQAPIGDRDPRFRFTI
ncbi:major facilitator superfamily domain-containing protein, partial [Phakopsora pachyrhizi]